MLQMLKTARGRLAALTIAPTAWAMSHVVVLAEEGDNANVRGALETNQDALGEIEESTLTSEGIADASQTLTNSLLAFVGFLGIGMVACAVWKSYKISSEGEQARDSMVGPVLMGVFGALMTVSALVTAAFVNAFFGLGET
jgi:hypothetical protein